MATTTFALIRAGFEAQVTALVPTVRADVAFRESMDEIQLRDWAVANPGACFRRFTFVNRHDWGVPVISGTDVIEVVHTCVLEVAYPPGLAVYGAGNLRAVDDLIESDMDQLDDAIGLHGYPNYVSGLAVSQLAGTSIEVVDSIRLLSMTFELQYLRSRA